MSDEVFFDTNIICYAFDRNQPDKRAVCERLLNQVLDGEITAVVSGQVIGETFRTGISKLGLTPEQAKTIVQEMIRSDKWRKVNYTHNTVNGAVEKFERFGVYFWDLLISETMKENGIKKIITENERDFGRIQGIEVINPFRTQ